MLERFSLRSDDDMSSSCCPKDLSRAATELQQLCVHLKGQEKDQWAGVRVLDTTHETDTFSCAM